MCSSDLNDRLEHLILQARVVANQLVDRGSNHVAVVPLGKDPHVSLRGEDGKVARDDGPVVELGEALGVETERADGVGDGLQNLCAKEVSAECGGERRETARRWRGERNPRWRRRERPELEPPGSSRGTSARCAQRSR